MKKQSRSTRRTNRARSVASASGLALILGLVNAAVGASITDHIANPPLSVSDISITSTAPTYQETLQFQDSSITAPISNSPLFTSAPGTVVNPNGSTVTISANSLLAEAISNSSLQTFTVGTIPAGNDFSIATGQATALDTGKVVTASITNSPAQIAFSNSSNTVTGNSIQADVTLNQSTASIDHTFVAGSASPLSGTASASGNGTTWSSDTTGNGVISNAQLAINSGGKTGSGALVTGSGVKVDATTNAMLPTDTITVTKNDIGTSYTGNEASSTYKGAGVNFDGSVAVSSLQLNQEASGGPTNPTAHVTNSGIAVTTGTHPIAGTVTVAQNNIAAQTTGNTAVNGAHVTATSVTGTNQAPALGVDATIAGFEASVGSSPSTGATLALANAQRNNDAYLGSTIDNSHITVSGANGGGGAISVVNNDSQAAVMGNQAVNAAGLDATDIHGASTGIANTQVNGNTSMVASNATNVQVSRGTNQIAHSGAIVLDHNSIGSSAVGSAASNLTTIASDTDVLSTADGAAFATASKQRMHAVSTTSATTTGNVQALLDNSVANTPVNATITHNTLASLAQGNSVANRTQIGSGAGSYGASVDNAQEFSENSSSSASTSSHLVGVTLKNSASPAASTVVVGDNALTAWANGNQAVNQLASTAGTTLDTGSGGHQLNNNQFMYGAVGATTQADYVGIDAQGGVAGQSDVLDNNLDATAIGNLADSTLALTAGTSLAITPAGVRLTNEQSTRTHDITATTSGDVGVKASGVSGSGTWGFLSDNSHISDANVLGNTLGATAIANQASNALGLTAGTTLSVNDASPELSNTQTSAAGVFADTDGDIGVQASTGLNVTSTSAISGDVNVLNNALDASAVANTASNTATLAALTMESGVNATLVNDQSSSGAVGATTDGSFSIQATGGPSVGSNTVSDDSNVSDNALRAQAAGNQASNSLAMQAGTMLADVSATLTNDQTTTGTVAATATGAAGILASGAALSNAISGNSSVSGNVFGSTALGNQAASTLALSTDAALATAGTALRNTQDLDAEVSASTTADVGIRATGTALINTVSGQSTVQDNALASAGTGNLATNVLALTGGTTLDVGTVGGGGDASLSSTQTAGSVTAGTEGGFGIQAAGNIIGGGNTVSNDATVSGNTANADATGNRAANQLAMTAGTVLSGDGSLSNTQTANNDIRATTVVDVGITATGTALANTVSGNTSVLDNTSSSAATGNFANNELALQAGTLVADGGSTLTNEQTTGTSAINASTSGGIGIVAGGGTGASLANSLSNNNTVSGNTMSSDAVANQAVNLLSMASDTTLAAGAGTQLSNSQTSGSAASADTAGGVGMQAGGTGNIAGFVSGNASVLDNTLSARAGQNEAANTLRLDAGTLANAGDVQLVSDQEATGSSTATVTTNTDTVGIMATGTLGSLLGVATVTGNTLQSVAFANSATNLLAIDAATGNQSDASFDNTQSNSGPVAATTTLGGSLGVDVGGTVTGVVGSVVNVNDNQVGASAYGNSAANVLNANGGAGVPGYALAGTNTQTNSGAINAAINGPSGSGASIGLNTGTASSAYTANVLGNQVAAVAYGNTAYNQLTASSSVGMVPTSAALTSSQSNTANVTATVSNMGIGVVGSGSGGTGAGVAVISGNGVSATAVGNASVNHMVIGN